MHRWVAISTLCIWPILANSEITSATYEEPTDIYGHGAVANGEYAVLSIGTDSSVFRIRYDGAVFEDTQPRLVDLNGDGAPEVVAVRSGFTTGASIVVFGLGDAGKIEESLTKLSSSHPIFPIPVLSNLPLMSGSVKNRTGSPYRKA